MTSDTIIPAYPYEGAFYWFLASGHAHSQSHPYYRVLYGASPTALSSRAAAIIGLYPNIMLGAADAHLPDSGEFLSGSMYHHPELGISLDYRQNEWSPEIQSIARAAGSERVTQQLLAANPLFANDRDLQHHFLCRTALQIYLAARTGAMLIGDDFFQRAYTAVAPWVTELALEPLPHTASKLELGERALAVTGLDFAPASLDAFAAIRASKDIAGYAASFRSTLLQSQDAESCEDKLIELMVQAMDTEDVARRAAGAFQTAGSAMTVLGFVPIVGTITSAIGVTTDVTARIATAKAERARWWILGAKFREIAMRDALKRRRSG